MSVQSVEFTLPEGRVVSIETGKLAKQANGSVVVKVGDTYVLCNATMSGEPKSGLDFFPLTCDFEERKYAVGKIPVRHRYAERRGNADAGGDAIDDLDLDTGGR